jgi:hypothetical protein
MYPFIIAAFMVVLPGLSVAAEAMMRGVPLSIVLVGKWFVFWMVGVRLLAAGLRQISQPEYTARTILKLTGNDALVVIRELGFANVAMGLLGAASLPFPDWRSAAALMGGVFYGLAAGHHVLQAHRGRLQNIALVSDAFAAIVLLVSFGGLIR